MHVEVTAITSLWERGALSGSPISDRSGGDKPQLGQRLMQALFSRTYSGIPPPDRCLTGNFGLARSPGQKTKSACLPQAIEFSTCCPPPHVGGYRCRFHARLTRLALNHPGFVEVRVLDGFVGGLAGGVQFHQAFLLMKAVTDMQRAVLRLDD
jgi:hypothetical protein